MVKRVENSGFFSVRVGDINQILMLVGSTGSGKSVLTNSIAWQLKHFKNYKIIYITEKPDSPMENCFCGIKRNNSRQERQLIADWMNRDNVISQEEIEIFHPFTFNFPTVPVPNVINLFTFPIKEIEELAYSALLGRDIESPAVMLCQEVAKELAPEDDMYSFLFKCFQKSSLGSDGGSNFVPTKEMNNMGLPGGSYGSKRDIEQIRYSLAKLNQHYMLQNGHCSLNLTNERLIAMLNSQKTTFFTLWRIEDDKVRYFTYIQLLLKISRLIRENAKRPILIILEEIKILLSKNVTLRSEQVLIAILRRMMAGMRTSGRGVTICTTTQSYYETNPDFRDGVDEVILMKLGAEDQKSIDRDFHPSATNMAVLNSLKRGQAVLFSELRNKDEEANKYRAFYVPFAHREEGYPTFWTHWKHNYPDQMIKYKAIIKEMRKNQEKSFAEQLKRQQEFIEDSKRKISELRKEKKKAKEDNDEEEDEDTTEEEKTFIKIESVVKKKKAQPTFIEQTPDQHDLNPRLSKISQENTKIGVTDVEQHCYNLAKDTPESTWKARTVLLEDIDHNTVQMNAIRYAAKQKDYKFLKYFCDRDVVLKEFPELSEVID